MRDSTYYHVVLKRPERDLVAPLLLPKDGKLPPNNRAAYIEAYIIAYIAILQ